GCKEGRPEGDVEDGHLDASKLPWRTDFRSNRFGSEIRGYVLYQYPIPYRRNRARGNRRRNNVAPPASVSGTAGSHTRSGLGWTVPMAPGWRVPHVQPGHYS